MSEQHIGVPLTSKSCPHDSADVSCLVFVERVIHANRLLEVRLGILEMTRSAEEHAESAMHAQLRQCVIGYAWVIAMQFFEQLQCGQSSLFDIGQFVI